MNIFILLALVLGASAWSENCPTAKDICAGHVKCADDCPCPLCIPREQPREATTGCCRASSARCMACGAGITEEKYCAENPYTFGCKKAAEMTFKHFMTNKGRSNRAYKYCAENPNASDCRMIIEEFCAINPNSHYCTPLLRAAGTTEYFKYFMKKEGYHDSSILYCAENPNASGCRTIKEKFCATYPDFASYCTPLPRAEVELSALDTLEALLASTAGMTFQQFMKNKGRSKHYEMAYNYCAANPHASSCRKLIEEFCAINPNSHYCTSLPRPSNVAPRKSYMEAAGPVTLHQYMIKKGHLERSYEYCAKNQNSPSCSMVIEEFCDRNPDSDSPYCIGVAPKKRYKAEVELSALDTLEALLARSATRD